jgi:hypothetical protein
MITKVCACYSLTRKGIHTVTGGRWRWYLYLHLGRYTIIRLSHIVLLVYSSSCRKWYKNWLPGTGIKHLDMSAISITICLQTKEVHRNRTVSCDYRYTGSSGKQDVTLKFSHILRELLIALHVILQRQPNDMGLEIQCSDGLAIC